MKRIILLILIAIISKLSWGQTTISLVVEGEVTTPLTLKVEDLAKMKRANATLKDHDGKAYQYSGVPLVEILKQAGVTLGKDLRGNNLRKYLLVKAADGYQVVFALAELDSSFTDKLVIIADQMEGKSLPADKGPFRIVVHDEKRPARSAFQVTHLIIRYAKD